MTGDVLWFSVSLSLNDNDDYIDHIERTKMIMMIILTTLKDVVQVLLTISSLLCKLSL